MTYTATMAAGGLRVAATALAGTIQAIGSNRAWVNAPGANFLTNGCRIFDVATIAGSTSNDALWAISEVVDEDNLILSGTFVTEAAAGTVAVQVGSYLLAVFDELTPTWGAIAADTTQVVNAGAGVRTTDILKTVLVPPPENPKTLYAHAFTDIEVDFTVLSAVDWVSTQELVINVNDAETRGFSLRVPAGGGNVDAPNSVIRIGQKVTAGDDLSGTGSSLWAGYAMAPATFAGAVLHIPHQVHASMITNHSTLDGANLAQVGVNGEFCNSIFNGGTLLFALPNNALDVNSILNPIIACPVTAGPFTGISATAGIDAIDNVTISNNGTTGITLQPGGVIEGLLTSGDVDTPLAFFDFPAPGIIADSRNQRGDLTLFQTFGAMPNVLDYGLITYTAEPQIAYRNERDETFVPLDNVTVVIRELEDSYILEFVGADPQPAGTYRVTILGTDYDYVAGAPQNAINIAQNLAPLVDADPNVISGVATVSNDGPPGSALPNGAGIWIEKVTSYEDLNIAISSPSDAMTFVDNEVSNNTYTTNSEGKINGGVPIILRRGLTSFATARGSTEYTIALDISGPDIRPEEVYTVLDFKYEAVFPVELASPNWDGELDAIG